MDEINSENKGRRVRYMKAKTGKALKALFRPYILPCLYFINICTL